MQYKVLPFVASIGSREGAAAAASQLESLANKMAQDGWEYVRMENVYTLIAGSKGCMDMGCFGATAPTQATYSMVVFRKG